ncbi:hypothetical protein M8J75_007475 [Diaphorina citri]|nr:hypothetical protein M8J75_007475 [Diaphorina citri]
MSYLFVAGPHVFKKSSSGWYYVRIVSASKCPQKKALSLIEAYVQPLKFVYYDFRHIQRKDEYSFFIDDFEVARKLFYSRGQIKTECHHTLLFLVTSTTPPFVISDSNLKIIRSVISHRYNPDSNTLDLSRFHDDPELLRADCLICGIISSTLPDLKAINLNGNKIFNRDCLTMVAKAAPRLISVHLKNNNLKDIQTLSGLSALDLQELYLADNPFSKEPSEALSVADELMTLFPNLRKLDEVILESKNPKPVCTLPSPEPIFLSCNYAKLFTRVFVEQYFEVFDTLCRQELALFYHEDVQFSLVAIDGKGKNAAISSLIKSSRNLKRVSDPNKQDSLLHKGKHNVMEFLKQFPYTKHDRSSFTCDCPVMTSSLIHLTVCGLYEQLSPAGSNRTGLHKQISPWSSQRIFIAFNRAFVFIPDTSGKFAISNDQLFVTGATQEQYIRAFSSLNGLELMLHDGLDAKERQRRLNLIRELSLATGTELNVSEEALMQSGWDYECAIDSFKRSKEEAHPREKMSPSCTRDEMSPSCTRDEMSPSCTRDEMSPSCTRDEMSPSCTRDEMSPSCTRDEMSPSCTRDEMSPSCTRDEMSLSCTRDEMSPSCTRNEMSPSCTRDEMSPSCTRDEMSPSCTRDEMSPSCTRDEMSPSCTRDEMSPSCTRDEMSPSCTRDEMSPSCTRDEMSPSCTRNEMSPSCTTDVMSPSCTTEVMSPSNEVTKALDS